MQFGEDFSTSKEANSFIEITFCPFWTDIFLFLSAILVLLYSRMLSDT